MNVLKEQYDLVKHTRKVLFHFCEQIDLEDYLKEVDGYGWGSIRNLHVHIAECYQSWLGRLALEIQEPIVAVDDVTDVNEMRTVFERVDQLVYNFLEEYDERYDEKISREVPWQEEEEELSPLWLMTHTITHEFHHKGQIVTLARALGYEPTDTDLLTPSDINRYLDYPEQG
ncbi:DinB family protein [Guptibacillus hwajinpoensis]|uniref:DinB family protein n=1 Tax=Guptibacillus hwajinpoensis TaxID=208199 RepID=UPI003D052DA3